MRRRHGRVRRRRDRAGPPARACRAGRTDRPPATRRRHPARASDRRRHAGGDPIRHRARTPRADRGPHPADPRRARDAVRCPARGRPDDPDRRARREPVGRDPRRVRRPRSGPDLAWARARRGRVAARRRLQRFGIARYRADPNRRMRRPSAPAAGPTGRLAGRLVALGVTGSIAAYKAPEIVRRLQDEGADVAALLPPSAARFVAPLALEALTRHAVDVDVTGLLSDRRIGHIVVADSADAILVAPATAHWLGAMANGLAADPVTATCLATSAPVVVAPAMDGEMYAHPATRANVRRLRDEFGYRIVEPAAGPLASGQQGVGRLADVAALVDAVVEAIGDGAVREPRADRVPARAAPGCGGGPRGAGGGGHG